MNIEFECDCSEAISEFTRGNNDPINSRIKCDECGAVFAVTVSRLK